MLAVSANIGAADSGAWVAITREWPGDFLPLYGACFDLASISGQLLGGVLSRKLCGLHSPCRLGSHYPQEI